MALFRQPVKNKNILHENQMDKLDIIYSISPQADTGSG